MPDLAECFAEEAATDKQQVRVGAPPMPDDGLPTTMEIVRAVQVIHEAYMKNCAAAHAAELEATRQRLYLKPVEKLRPSLDL